MNSKRKNVDIPNSVFLNDLEGSSGTDISKLFALHFRSSFTISDPPLPALLDSPVRLEHMWIAPDELSEAILYMMATAGPGPGSSTGFLYFEWCL